MPLLTDGRIETGFVRERRILASLLEPEVPAMALKYAQKVSAKTDLPLETVLRSKSFLNYLKALKS